MRSLVILGFLSLMLTACGRPRTTVVTPLTAVSPLPIIQVASIGRVQAQVLTWFAYHRVGSTVLTLHVDEPAANGWYPFRAIVRLGEVPHRIAGLYDLKAGKATIQAEVPQSLL